uniref:Metalloendopeptidase n=1 Tax=Leptobrachium leishanense TaxID=445787 RepID=A0A8C5QNA9_9ANUR
MSAMAFPLLLILISLHHALPFPSALKSRITPPEPRDIIQINQAFGLDLFEGDIIIDKTEGKNAIIGDTYKWPLTVPYYLEDSLEINAKAVILDALERFRLKTCIDFKPWAGESDYISFFKDNGCYSYVGNRHMGRQILSIGPNCDDIVIVQHELLHALGFWHEQSRSDRDDYVTIVWDEINPANRHNFNSYDDTVSSFLNVPYDYTSVMHYAKNAFQIDTNPTIIAKNPKFTNLIGQRLDFSDKDTKKLHDLYDCATPSTFLSSCSFDLDDICGFLQNSDSNSDWQQVSHVSSGPTSDHTYLQDSNVTGHFMHFSTATGDARDKAIFESRLFYPKRDYQCLEFFYYNSGHESDRLEIWIKEYTATSPNGAMRLISNITGQPAAYWQLHYSSLGATGKFRFLLYGIKGNGASNGGISLDDINLSETECPEHVWHIRKFSLDDLTHSIYSPPFYSKYGYAYQVSLRKLSLLSLPFNIATYIHLITGANDDHLQWPCPWKQVTVEFMDQNPDIKHRASSMKSITTDPQAMSESNFAYDKPEKIGFDMQFPNGTSYKMVRGEGRYLFTVQEWFNRRDFIKGGDAFVLISMKDVSDLLKSQPTPTTTVTKPPTNSPTLCTTNICKNEGVCILENSKSVCRCKTYGEFWYVGETCEKKVPSNSNEVTMYPSVTLCVAMLTFILSS